MNDGAVILGTPAIAGAGYRSTLGSGAVTVGTPTVAGAGYRSTRGSGAVTVAKPVVAGTGRRSLVGSGAVTIPSLMAGNNTAVPYASVVLGRVVTITYGPQPDSTTSVLYVSLADISPTPSAEWYYSEICNEFNVTAPVILAGDIAPPFVRDMPVLPPGSTPPGTELPPADDPDIRSNVFPALITWAADATGALTIPAVPEEETSLGDKYHLAYDFSEVCYLRLQAEVITPASEGAVLKLQFLFEGVWLDLEYIAPEEAP